MLEDKVDKAFEVAALDPPFAASSPGEHRMTSLGNRIDELHLTHAAALVQRRQDAALADRDWRGKGIEHHFRAALEPGFFHLITMHRRAKHSHDIISFAPGGKVGRLRKRLHRDLLDRFMEKNANLATARQIALVGWRFEVAIEFLH